MDFYSLYHILEAHDPDDVIDSAKWEDIEHEKGVALGGMGSEKIYYAPLKNGATVVVKKPRDAVQTVSEYLAIKLFNVLSLEGVQAPKVKLIRGPDSQLYIVMSHYTGLKELGSLVGQLRHGGPQEREEARQKLRQVNRAVTDAAGVAHAFLDSRDVGSGGNVLFDPNNPQKIVNLDFGAALAKNAQGGDRFEDSPDRKSWDQGFGAKLRDLWSIGTDNPNIRNTRIFGPNQHTGEERGLHGDRVSLIRQVDHILGKQKEASYVFQDVKAEVKSLLYDNPQAYQSAIQYISRVEDIVMERFVSLGRIKKLLLRGMSMSQIQSDTKEFE